MNKFNFVSILMGLIQEKIGAMFYAKKEVVLPEYQAEYRLVSRLSEPGLQETVVGLYKNNKGHQIVVKIWEGRYPNFSYLSLLNEITIYKTLTKVAKRIDKKNTKSTKQSVSIPKHLFSKVSSNRLVLAIEYAKGSELEKYSDKKIMESYKKSITFIRSLSVEMTDQEKRNLSVRTGRQYIFIFLLSWIVACVKNPKTIKSLIKALFFYIRNVSELMKDRPATIVHRDLNFKNILVDKDNIYVVDLQMMIITYPIVEYINTLQYCFDIGRVKNQMINEISTQNEDNILIKLLAIHYAVQCLTNNKFAPKVVKSFKNYLRYGINL